MSLAFNTPSLRIRPSKSKSASLYLTCDERFECLYPLTRVTSPDIPFEKMLVKTGWIVDLSALKVNFAELTTSPPLAVWPSYVLPPSPPFMSVTSQDCLRVARFVASCCVASSIFWENLTWKDEHPMKALIQPLRNWICTRWWNYTKLRSLSLAAFLFEYQKGKW